MSRFCIGIDLGKVSDPSAVVVLDRGAPGSRDRRRGRLDVRVAQRLALGQPYQAQLDRIATILERADEPGAMRRIAIDSTGVGTAVMEMAREKLRPSPYGIAITAGSSPSVDGMDWKVPKQDLVAALQVAIEGRKLRIARSLPEGKVLGSELKAYRATMSAGGTTFANDPTRAPHDDLVVATMLACYLAKRADSGGQAYFDSLSWTCEVCGLPNLNDLPSCPRDGADKPPPISDLDELSPGEPESWNCSHCLSLGREPTENPGSRERCLRCGTPRPIRPEPKPDWRCEHCGSENTDGQNLCPRCGAPYPEPTPPGVIDIRTHQPTFWRAARPHPYDPRTFWPG